MKHIFLLICTILFAIIIKAQEFAPIGAEWYYNERFAFSGDIDFIKFISEKDTIINGKTCSKLTKRHKLYCFGRPDTEFLYSSNDTVYFFYTIFNEFQNLYIFNSIPNDSWIIKIKDEEQEVGTITIRVDSVSTIQINGQNLKALHVTYNKNNEISPESYSSTIIEKIGDIQYMFNWSPWTQIACDANWTDGLRCYQDSEIGLYSTGIVDSCDYIYNWATANFEKQNERIVVYPNPAKDKIEISYEKCQKVNIEIFELTGKLILSEIIQTNEEFNISNLNSGIYLIKITDEEKNLFTNKLIKQ